MISGGRVEAIVGVRTMGGALLGPSLMVQKKNRLATSKDGSTL